MAPRPERPPPLAANAKADGVQDSVDRKQSTIAGDIDDEFQEIVPGWPLLSTSCIFFIEFCERFSTVGVRLILSKYVSDSLGFSGEIHIVIFLQLFAFLSLGASPIGAFVSDLFAGKFWTLFWTLCLLFICEVLLIVSLLFFPMGHFGFPFLELLGLFLLAAFSGALKPSLAAMGADQFFHIPFNYLEISCFFAIFYFIGTAANLSAVFAFPTMLMFPCFGYESCIILPFAIPALLIFICAVLLICTICLYDRPFGPPVGIFMVYRAIGTVRKALTNRRARASTPGARPPPAHWLDYFMDDHSCITDGLCNDKRRYMPIEEPNLSSCAQTDLWKRQAICLDPMTALGVAILPAHMPLLHILLLLICLPIFQLIVYPLWFRCCCCFPTVMPFSYLKRMTGGALLLALSYTSSAALQHIVDMTQPPQPSRGDVFLKVINHFPATCSLTVTDMGPITLNVPSRETVPFSISSDDIIQLEGPLDGTSFIRIQPVITFSADCLKHHEIRYKMNALGLFVELYMLRLNVGHVNYIHVTPQGILSRSMRYEKPDGGAGESLVSVNLALPCKTVANLGTSSASCASLTTDLQRSLTVPAAQALVLCHIAEGNSMRVANADASGCDVNDPLNVVWNGEETAKAIEPMLTLPPVGDKTGKASVATYAPKSVQAGSYRLYLASGASNTTNATKRTFSVLVPVGGQFKVTGVGGIYMLTLALTGSVLFTGATPQPTLYIETISLPNMLSIQWQLPQYLFVVFAEILFCVTGLEFAYVEAPVVLKSLVLSMWFTGSSCGCLISFFLKFILDFNRLVDQFFFNAGTMYAFTAVFALLAYSYYIYFNFSLPIPEDGTIANYTTEDGMSVEAISSHNAVPAFGDDDVKRASLRIAAPAARRVTRL